MLHSIFFFLLGLTLILFGGSYLTDGATSIARRFNISSLVIGVTVVAFGSSTPDLVVGVTSTLQGHSGLAVGDVVGANIFDLLLVVGIVALISPIGISKSSKETNIPFLALSSLALFFCADDVFFDGEKENFIDRTDGLLLLVFLIIFTVQTLRSTRADSCRCTPEPAPAEPAAAAAGQKNIWITAVMVIGGLAALVVGGNWLVDGASGIARELGMSEGLIGLTVVGIGASVPDLATSVIAAVKNRPGIALGNVVGSCIINVFLILGVCGTLRPLNAEAVTILDFGTLAGAGLLVWAFSLRGRITRAEGAVLVLCYAAYMVRLVQDFIHGIN